MSLGFERPLLALAAPFIIALAIIIGRRFKNPFNFSMPLGAPGGIPFKPPQNIDGLIKILRMLEYCGALLLLLGASGPIIKNKETIWLDRGADVLFVIDVSPSMAALDMNGANRFNTARRLIVQFAEGRPADSIGLVAVGSDAALLIPPTTDRQALVTRIGQLRIGEMGDGTALGNGLATAAFHLEKSTAPRRVVVLLTDGENNAGAIHPHTAAEMLKNLGVSLYVVGIGSFGEVPIDYVDPTTKMRRTGTLDSRFDTESLRMISNAGGGNLILAPSADALEAAFARIDDRELVVRRQGFVTRKRSCRLPFLFASLLILAGIKLIWNMLFAFGFSAFRNEMPRPLRRRLFASAVFFGLFLIFCVIALVRPEQTYQPETALGYQGLDVVIACDLSRSMQIKDVEATSLSAAAQGDKATQSRLERGISLARDAAAGISGVRFAVAVGRGRGVLAVPLTWDVNTVLSFLDAADSGTMSGGGTNLESLLDAASEGFHSSFPARRIILLVSDGEALSGSLKAALDRLSQKNIAVAALALGSDSGGQVPGLEGTISRRDAQAMRQAAGRTDGIYIDANNENAQAELMGYLRSNVSQVQSAGNKKEKKQHWHLFVLAAAMCYAASRFCLLKRAKTKVLPALCVFLLCSCGGAGTAAGKLFVMEGNYLSSQGRHTQAVEAYSNALAYRDAAPYAESGLGVLYFSLGETAAALDRLNGSLQLLEAFSPHEHRELRYQNYYHSGIVFFVQEDFPAAAAAFREALRIDPVRIEAKRNLELSLLSIDRGRTQTGRTQATLGESESSQVLFDYMQQKEQNQWKSREWLGEEEGAGPDY